jgi:hypothetical protein
MRGRKPAAIRRKKTTISLFSSAWDCLDFIGPSRSRAVESMIRWSKKSPCRIGKVLIEHTDEGFRTSFTVSHCTSEILGTFESLKSAVDAVIAEYSSEMTELELHELAQLISPIK